MTIEAPPQPENIPEPADFPRVAIEWPTAVRIIRAVHPPIDLFEDIADPADWALIIAAEQKTNPRLMATLGNIDLVPVARRVGGHGASYLMAPFTHVSMSRPSRFSAGRFGLLYAGTTFEVALFETMHHHARFMAATAQPPGWTSQFREIQLRVAANPHDLRGLPRDSPILSPDQYVDSQAIGLAFKHADSDGLLYPSVRHPSGECVALYYPDLAANPIQGRHLDYHWDGRHIDLYREAHGQADRGQPAAGDPPTPQISQVFRVI